MSLTVLNVSYPFAQVDEDPVGGAEQVLSRIDHALVEAGHRSLVLAPEGSRAYGELLAFGAHQGELDQRAQARLHRRVRVLIDHAIADFEPDIVHLHGVDFCAYLPAAGAKVMVTLHLPLAWYPPDALHPRRPRTWLNPVSETQARSAPPSARLAAPIPNGVPIARPGLRKGKFALALGRICPEKGFDDALAASVRSGIPLLLAGKVFPYREHQLYLEEQVRPRLSSRRRWIGPVSGTRKQSLLARARCLLVPSKVPETSSLVAMEALAAGTPVIAYRAGALTDIVEHGRTGFLVDTVEEMAEAMARADTLDPMECHRTARERFCAATMTRTYIERYAALAAAA